MAGDSVAALVSHAGELERQDRLIAEEIAALGSLADRAGEVRARGASVRTVLDRLPDALDEVARRTTEASAECDAARDELRLADEKLASLERGRRRKQDDLERARREAATAHDRFTDACAQVERLRERDEQLRADGRALREEGAALAAEAKRIAGELSDVPRVADAARQPPGGTLGDIEEWGLLVRSALFVARGTLETERERIVAEANVLGAAALGEPLTASSVALVRRRLETELS